MQCGSMSPLVIVASMSPCGSLVAIYTSSSNCTSQRPLSANQSCAPYNHSFLVPFGHILHSLRGDLWMWVATDHACQAGQELSPYWSLACKGESADLACSGTQNPQQEPCKAHASGCWVGSPWTHSSSHKDKAVCSRPATCIADTVGSHLRGG